MKEPLDSHCSPALEIDRDVAAYFAAAASNITTTKGGNVTNAPGPSPSPIDLTQSQMILIEMADYDSVAPLPLRVEFLHHQMSAWHDQADEFIARIATGARLPFIEGGMLYASGQPAIRKLMRSFDKLDFQLHRYDTRFRPEVIQASSKIKTCEKDETWAFISDYIHDKSGNMSRSSYRDHRHSTFSAESGEEGPARVDKGKGAATEEDMRRWKQEEEVQHQAHQLSPISEAEENAESVRESFFLGLGYESKPPAVYSGPPAKSSVPPNTSLEVLRRMTKEDWLGMRDWLLARSRYAPRLETVAEGSSILTDDEDRTSAISSAEIIQRSITAPDLGTSLTATPSSRLPSTSTRQPTEASAITPSSTSLRAGGPPSLSSSPNNNNSSPNSLYAMPPSPQLEAQASPMFGIPAQPENMAYDLSCAINIVLYEMHSLDEYFADLQIERQRSFPGEGGAFAADNRHSTLHRQLDARVEATAGVIRMAIGVFKYHVEMTGTEKRLEKRQRRRLARSKSSSAPVLRGWLSGGAKPAKTSTTEVQDTGGTWPWGEEESEDAALALNKLYTALQAEPTRTQRLAGYVFRKRIDMELLGLRCASVSRSFDRFVAARLLSLIDSVDARTDPDPPAGRLLELRTKMADKLRSLDDREHTIMNDAKGA